MSTRTREQEALFELHTYFVHALRLWSTRHEDKNLDLEMSHILATLTLMIEDLATASGLDPGAVFLALAMRCHAEHAPVAWPSGPVH